MKKKKQKFDCEEMFLWINSILERVLRRKEKWNKKINYVVLKTLCGNLKFAIGVSNPWTLNNKIRVKIYWYEKLACQCRHHLQKNKTSIQIFESRGTSEDFLHEVLIFCQLSRDVVGFGVVVGIKRGFLRWVLKLRVWPKRPENKNIVKNDKILTNSKGCWKKFEKNRPKNAISNPDTNLNFVMLSSNPECSAGEGVTSSMASVETAGAGFMPGGVAWPALSALSFKSGIACALALIRKITILKHCIYLPQKRI